MRRIGCLIIIVILVIAAWLTRARWLPLLPYRIGGGSATAAPTSTWQAMTVGGAARARDALERLNQPNGPASVVVTPGDLGSYIFQELSRSLPPSADSIQAAAIGDRLYVRAVVRTAELGGANGLGPLGALLGEKERIELGGTLRIIRPGLAELQVKQIKLRELSLPAALIPRIVQQMSRGERPRELAPDGLALRTPDYIGKVEVSDGKITLFRALGTADTGNGKWEIGLRFASVPISYFPHPLRGCPPISAFQPTCAKS